MNHSLAQQRRAPGLRPVLAALGVLLTLAGCSGNDDACPRLIGGGNYCLQATGALAPFAVQQKVELDFRGRRETLIVELESDADDLRVVALTPFGQKLLQIRYDNRTTSASTLAGGPVDARLSPAMLLALLQIALWPADSVRAGLAAPLTLAEDASGRRLLNRDETVLSVEYQGAQPPWERMQLHVHPAGLAIDIETLPEIGMEDAMNTGKGKAP